MQGTHPPSVYLLVRSFKSRYRKDGAKLLVILECPMRRATANSAYRASSTHGMAMSTITMDTRRVTQSIIERTRAIYILLSAPLHGMPSAFARQVRGAFGTSFAFDCSTRCVTCLLSIFALVVRVEFSPFRRTGHTKSGRYPCPMPDQTNGVLKRDHEDIMVFRLQFAVCLCLSA